MLIVGRDDVLRFIGEQVADARRGQGRVVIVEGEAGSGKTTVLSEAVRQATGFQALTATAREIDRDRPFGVISDALGLAGKAHDVGRDSIARAIRSGMELGFDETLRYRIVEGVVSLTEREAISRPVLLALDDMHWADDPTNLVLNHLGRRLPHLPVCAVVARRPPQGPGGDPFEALGADSNVARVVLEPLSDEEVSQLCERVIGAAPAQGLRTVLAKAGGNPFFVNELLAALREDRSIDIRGTTADVAVVDIKPELRMVILRRLGGLTAGALNVLRMASVLGTTFSAADLAVALAQRASDLVEPLAEAIGNGVLRADDDRLTFRHDLVRTALYGDIPASVRAALHLQIAHALRDAGASAVRCAPHFASGAAFADDAAIDGLRSAADEVATTEPRTALAWLARAQALARPSDERHDAIADSMCAVLIQLGDGPATERLARSTLARPQPPRRRASLIRSLAAGIDSQDRCLEASQVSAAESRAEDLDEVERVRFAAEAIETRSHVERTTSDPDARAVLQQAERIGDSVAIRWVLAALYHSAMWRGDYREALALGLRFKETGDSDRNPSTGAMLGRALAHVDTADRALDALRHGVRELEARGDIRPVGLMLTEIATLEAEKGLWSEAVSDAEAALELALEYRQDVRHDEAAALLATLAIRRDEVDRAVRLLGSLRGARRFVAASADAMLAEALGDGAKALATLREAWRLAAETGRASDLPRYAPDLVRLEVGAGEFARASTIDDELEHIAAQRDIDSITFAARRVRGIAKADAAAALEAVDIARRIGLVDRLALASEDAAATLFKAGRAADAGSLMRDAAAYYESVGATRDLRRAELALRGFGMRRGKRGPRQRAKSGWESLSETERRVVDLAGAGLTNAEIGARLFISGRTVERHLTHIYAKVGVSSRVELATYSASQRDRA
jgi:DNA-binding CsgD family transcriptional regulator